jgi:hypothetical protein
VLDSTYAGSERERLRASGCAIGPLPITAAQAFLDSLSAGAGRAAPAAPARAPPVAAAKAAPKARAKAGGKASSKASAVAEGAPVVPAAAPPKKAAAAASKGRAASRADDVRLQAQEAAAAAAALLLRAAPAPSRSGKRKRAASPAPAAAAAESAPPAPPPPAPSPAPRPLARPPPPPPPGNNARRSGSSTLWTDDEDNALIGCVFACGCISSFSARIALLQNPHLSSLFRLVSLYGEHAWARVAAALGCDKRGKQCRERYVSIKPGVIRGVFSADEEAALLRHHAELGNRWAEIARRMQRPENAVKNKWYGMQKVAAKAAAVQEAAHAAAMMAALLAQAPVGVPEAAPAVL